VNTNKNIYITIKNTPNQTKMIMANNNSNGNSLTSTTSTGDNTNSSVKKEPTVATKKESTVPAATTISQNTTPTTGAASVGTTEVKVEVVTKPTGLPIMSNSDSRWIFSLEKIEYTPSRIEGVTKENELHERQEAALFINDLGIKLKVNQLCINTAIIYMHRFYMIHSLKKFHHYIVATSCLFFACKVEEQPRRLREFIDIVQSLFHKSNEPINHNSEEYRHYGDQIMALESCLIQTLGFNVLINHAHTVIIKTCQMIKAPRDLAEAAYLTATNSLILTDFCVKFSSEKVACFCIYLACKWTSLIIPMSSEGMQWYEYVNHDIKEQELEEISKEYLSIYDKCSNKIKKKLGITKSNDEINPQLHPRQHQQQQMRKQANASQQHSRPINPNQASHPNVNTQNYNKAHHPNQPPNIHQPPQQRTHHSQSGQPHPNGFHPNSQMQQQQQQHRQLQQQQQQQRSAQNQMNKMSNSNTNSGHPNPNFNKQHPKNNLNNNGNGNPNYNKQNFINGAPGNPSSHQNPNQNLNSQPGAASSSNTKSYNNLNQKSDSQSSSGYSNGQNNSNPHKNKPLKPDQQTSNNNLSHKQTNGNNTNNNNNNNNNNSNLNLSLNSSQNRGSPGAQSNSSMKRGNEDLTNNVSTAPNKIPKYVIDQKSAS